MKKKPIQIKSLEQLKDILLVNYHEEEGLMGDYLDFALVLNGGCFSRKEIAVYRTPKTKQLRFDIRNCIDDSRQSLSEKQIMDSRYTNIGEAIIKGSFYHLIY